MIIIVFKVNIKDGKENEFKSVIAPQLIQSATENNSFQYLIYQNIENQKEFILHEKWGDKKTWENHLNNLIKIFGEKAEESILPKKLEEYFETTESIFYKED